LGGAHTNGKSSFLKNIHFFWTDIDPHMCCQSEAPVLCGIYKEISKNYPKCDSILLYKKKDISNKHKIKPFCHMA